MFNKEKKLWGEKECSDFEERMKHNSALIEIEDGIEIKTYDYRSLELQPYKSKINIYLKRLKK